jgi:DAACS family dicarboxylate/amino acid:cation (Na+ or H+) symporter
VTRRPLWTRVLLGAAAGIALGLAFGTEPWLFGRGNEALGQVGMLVIRMLKALATPLVALAIVDSFLKTRITGRSGLRLLAVCAVNLSVAMSLALVLLAIVHPQGAWVAALSALGTDTTTSKTTTATLDPLANLDGFVPRSLVDPFADNLILSVVGLSLLLGASLRAVRDGATGERAEAVDRMAGIVDVLYATATHAILWVAEWMPWAVCFIVADVVGKAGLGVFALLAPFLATVLLGLSLHALVWYPTFAWAVGGMAPRRLLRGGLDAIVTGVSCNSSLATMPITLRCLSEMGVSPKAARLSAAVGTNFNNDGIMLYEAMASIFLFQAVGIDGGIGTQLMLVLASIAAGIGVAGIPEAGLVILPLVLSAGGMSEAMVAVVVPLVVPIDWIVARVRSGVNVLADITVAVVLDRFERDDNPYQGPAPSSP